MTRYHQPSGLPTIVEDTNGHYRNRGRSRSVSAADLDWVADWNATYGDGADPYRHLTCTDLTDLGPVGGTPWEDALDLLDDLGDPAPRRPPIRPGPAWQEGPCPRRPRHRYERRPDPTA